MCGIAGYKVVQSQEPAVLDRMVRALHHRGPDSEGFYRTDGYQAGMRRLSINDLKTGDQPLYNENKNVVLLYNGEIYNSPELRKVLQGKGHKFQTHSDGEVVCHLYEEYGKDLFEKLDGMFAIALWIEDERKLILARDIPGEKPLYYARLSNTEIVFASEIKSLQRFPQLNKELDLQSIWDFPTFLWIPEPATIFKEVKALLPGHLLIADDKGSYIEKFSNQFNKQAMGVTDEEVIQETRRVVEEAVKSRLLSDVPLGSFLSGGLDSSIVATIARKYVNQLDTFTIGFEDIEDPYHGRADESNAASQYARKLNTKHHAISVDAGTFSELLETFCQYGDQPFAVSSGLGLLAVAKAAKEAGIKVLLSGDGADEVFGGYSWYEYLPLANKRVSLTTAADCDVSFQNYGMQAERIVDHLAKYNAHKRAWAWHYYASEAEKKKLFSSDITGQINSSHRFFKEYNSQEVWQEENYIRQDRKFYLPNEMLKKMDRMTMAYSVEGRAPFVAPSVLAHADKLKYSHLVRDGSLKWVLRKAFQDILPKEIIDRPKHGFNVPIDHWLKTSWQYLLEETFSKESYLSKQGIISKDSLKVAKKMVADPDRLNGHSIFCFIMMNQWMQRNLS